MLKDCGKRYTENLSEIERTFDLIFVLILRFCFAKRQKLYNNLAIYDSENFLPYVFAHLYMDATWQL